MVAFLGITVMRLPIQEKGCPTAICLSTANPPLQQAEMTGDQPYEDIGESYEEMPVLRQEIQDEAVFCHHCGRDVTSPKSHNELLCARCKAVSLCFAYSIQRAIY